MSRRLYEAFHDALELLAAGKSMEEALQAHPQFAAELKPLLETTRIAAAADSKPETEVDARERSRTRMLQHAERLRSAKPSHSSIKRPWRYSFAAIITAVILLLSTTGIWVASAQSLPGDPFYDLKRRAEELNLSLVSNKETRYELDLEFRRRRVDEVLSLLALNRVQTVTFAGILHEQDTGIWDVDSVLVIVHAGTRQLGPFTPGDEIEVEGVTTTSGAVLASSIELRRYRLIGPILSQNSPIWVIAGRSLEVSNAIIEEGIGPESLVEVEVRVSESGTHHAIRIRLVEASFGAGTQEPSMASEIEHSLQEQRFEGRIESLSGSAIVVDRQTILVLSSTEIEGVLSPGVNARVEAAQLADGSWVALEIKVVDGDEEDQESEGVLDEPSDDEIDESSDEEKEESEDPTEEPDEDEEDKEDEKQDDDEEDD